MWPRQAVLEAQSSRPEPPTRSFCSPPEGMKPLQARWGLRKTHAWHAAPAHATNYLHGLKQVPLPLGLLPPLHSGDNNPARRAWER